jgi:HD superfamily phosphohydrolase YqeK
MDPNDLIDTIVDAMDYVEVTRDFQGLVKARRLLNNDLRQAIDLYVQDEVTKAIGRSIVSAEPHRIRSTSTWKGERDASR